MMDRALKERIIGAVILVIFAVLVVPVLLDGRSDDAESLREEITLPGQDGLGRKQKTVVLERDRAEPVPLAVEAPRNEVKKSDDPPQVVDQPVVAARKPTPKAKSKPSNDAPAAKQESTTGMWAVQLGSFSNQANAERLASELRKQGYAAFLGQVQSSSGQLHRVRIGPQKDRAGAEAVAAKLLAQGHKGQVVSHP